MTSIYGLMIAKRKSSIWELWQQGRPMSFIAAAIEKPPATVFSYLLYYGGIEPRTRSRRLDALSFDEREFISRSPARGGSMRSIVKDLNRAPSSISREIARNGGVNGYWATLAGLCIRARSLRKARKPIQVNNGTYLGSGGF